MELVGAAASIVQLIHAAAALSHGVLYLCARFRSAAEEFCWLEKEVTWIRSELENCQQALENCHPSVLTSSTTHALTSGITQTTISLGHLSHICNGIGEVRGLKSRARWVVRDRAQAQKILVELRQVREYLHNAMQPLLVQGVSETIALQHDLRDEVLLISSNVQYLKQIHMESPLQSQPTSSAIQRTGDGGMRSATASIRHPTPTSQALGSFQVPIWFAQAIGSYAVALSVSIVADYAPPWNYGLRFGVSRVLRRTHPFFDALTRGDITDVRAKLNSGEGFLCDKDESNWTALAFAIKSGNVNLVEDLLIRGADIEQTIGQYGTNPLQWALWHKNLDVTRLLLRYGASQDHTNELGWSTVFFCWSRLRRSEPCMLEFVNLLAEDSILDLTVQDTQGWTVLDRVAAVGTPAEVQRLITFGANPCQEALPLRWSAIHQAVFEGNDATFETLRPHYGAVSSMTDERGWTLLHIAASAGHLSIVQRLLELGADPQAQSTPYGSHMPSILFDRKCTPREVAAAQSADREAQFIEAVEDFRLRKEYVMVSAKEDNEDAEFFDALETF